MFHDGATLLSPGRWCKEDRNLPSKPAWQNLRSSLDSLLEADLSDSGGLSKRCFQLAKIKTQPCSTECLVNVARSIGEWLVSHGSKIPLEKLLEISPGQPFRLSLLRELLKAANDGDFEFLEDAEDTGVTVGVLEPLPRTPSAFEEQTSWRLEDDPMASPLCFSTNYSSVAEHEMWVKQHLEEEVTEGLMERLSMTDLKSTFGENVLSGHLRPDLREKEAGP